MKTLNIEIPIGYEIDLEQSNLTEGKVVFKEIKKQYPKTWEELKKVKGFWVTDRSELATADSYALEVNRNVFPTKELAEASIAMAQLSQLREVYRQGWEPNWNNINEKKYCIAFGFNRIITHSYYYNHEFLSFQTPEIRDEFLNNFASLIETAKPLMS